MKKNFLVPACVLVVIAIGFIAYAVGHPELSFPWNKHITNILYGVYADVVLLLFVLAFCKKVTRLNIFTIIFELGAVFFLVQSMLNGFLEHRVNWYLPMALLLNCIGLLLNNIQLRKKKNSTDAKDCKSEKSDEQETAETVSSMTMTGIL